MKSRHFVFAATVLLCSPAFAESDEGIVANSPGARPTQSVEACWSQWLTSEGLIEGKNERNGYFLLVSKQKGAVPVGSDSRNWLAAREAMFSNAELEARKALAETMRTTIRSDRSAAVRMLGGDDAPSSLKPAIEQLSLADKTRVLADKAVDSEIKKFDPKWSGSSNQRAEKVATLQLKLSQNVESSADIFVSGAFTAIQCEGPSAEDEGRYSVLVGLIWSPILQKIAESIWDNSLRLPPAPPGMSLKDRFASFSAENVDWMAYSNGARVFTDENGNRVVVGFGVAPRTTLSSADQGRARLQAMAAIQRFLGEKVVARSTEQKRFEHRAFTDDTDTSFDSSNYATQIDAVSKELQLKGTADVGSWRGEHPWSKAGMQVVAIAWSQAWANDSRAISEVMQAVESRMQKQGAVPKSPVAPSLAPANSGRAPAATTAKPGARSSAKDF